MGENDMQAEVPNAQICRLELYFDMWKMSTWSELGEPSSLVSPKLPAASIL